MESPRKLRANLEAQAAAMREDYLCHGDARKLLRGRCAAVDSLLVTLWHDLELPEELTLVAVGGYGRGELFPASDIDVLILLPDVPDPGLKSALERLVHHFWDVGLEVGHSVRTIDECLEEAESDITVQTSLLEARLLCGSELLYCRFLGRMELNFNPLAFFQAKVLEQQERYQRFNDTPYSLEPNCKESPGGLRDIQVIFWVTHAAGYGNSRSDLVRHGLLTADEARDFETCETFLNHVRIRLHFAAGRREDRLLFDYQKALAEQFSYADQEGRRASEQLMQKYFRTARAVTLLNTILLQNVGAALSPTPGQKPEIIDGDFQNIDGLLDMRDPGLFEKNPAAIFQAFRTMQEHADLTGMTAPTLRALWRARHLITEEFRQSREARSLFLDILKAPRGIVHELRRMHQLDLLGAYLPAFSKVTGQMQHDLFHAYTVDQHTLQVIRNLRRFTMSEFTHEFPLCSQLSTDFERYWLLYIAAFFHDIAKGRGGDHSQLGMQDARAFCVMHKLSDEDTELVVWLVANHLRLSHTAQKEDISDPRVISRFAVHMADERRLTALYLLTVADIRGTSPKVWNQWKGKLLSDLFECTLEYLKKGELAGHHGIVAEHQAEALRLLKFHALSGTVHEQLWKHLDTTYFLRHSPEEIAWHVRALHYRAHNDQPVVKARIAHQEIGLQVMVYTRDQPDLFARIVGFFSRTGYSIVDAKVHTTQHGYALDSFILFDMSERESDRDMISYIEYELTERLLRQELPEAPSPGRISRQVKYFPIKPRVEISPDEKGTHYVLSLVAADRPGLLFQIASLLSRHHVNLETAKIATLGERAEDVFLISGGDLADSARRIRLEQELLEILTV
ncbi:MAG: Bifunctional uridylyltransferase/uridylyl-removing enzyme [Betaproteobacteria bacterium ADurb.Bin341]|nr:MAG: Bifunctional uridylyltransferase/uridylyl-removing enzyme [Betaproteobacteria bacterium ADurb.Bin341]